MNTQTRLHPRCVLLGAQVAESLTDAEAGCPDELRTPGLTREHSQVVVIGGCSATDHLTRRQAAGC